jgi:hypothetical protein
LALWRQKLPGYSGVLGDPSVALRKSIDAGAGYGMKYIEVYQNEILNLRR